MAKRKSSTKREQQPETISLNPLARASADADTLSAELNGIKHLAAFLGDFHQGSTSMQIPDQTKEWLRGILYDWISDTAGDLESRADRVLKFLNEQKAVA